MNKFEWDEAKNLANQQKHGISFEDAEAVFLAHHYIAESNYISESRFIAIGMTQNVMVAVVFTNRNGRIRIISVRKARKYEKSNYQAIFGDNEAN